MVCPAKLETYKSCINHQQLFLAQNVCSHYMLNHRIRGLLFNYKKTCYFAIGFNFFGKSQFGNILIPSVRMTLTGSKMFACVKCQIIE